MPGLKVNEMTRKEVLAAVRTIPPGQDFVWDGVTENERPLAVEELQAGIDADLKRRGRPAGLTKEQVAIRLDHEVLAAFRASGKGWQTRLNDALKDWLKTHSPV